MSRAGIRPDRDKATSNAIHARTRAAERLGLDLTGEDMDVIAGLAATASRDSMPLCPDPKFARREWVAVRWAGEWRGLVLDRATRSVVTFLPPHAIDRWRRSLPAADGVGPIPPSPGPVVGTVLGRVEAEAIPFPDYEPPETPPRTVAEARERMGSLGETIREMKWAIERCRVRSMASLEEEYIGRRKLAAAERVALREALDRTRAAASAANHSGQIDDLPLIDAGGPVA